MSDAYLVLKNSSIYKKIQCIEAHPLEEMTEEDWTELADTVEELIPNFIPMLKNRVSDRDYRICLLIRLGIPASLMARLLNLSDAVYGLLAVPNLIACYFLLPKVKQMLMDYEKTLKKK